MAARTVEDPGFGSVVKRTVPRIGNTEVSKFSPTYADILESATGRKRLLTTDCPGAPLAEPGHP